ncbi:MAG: discoidin domain-containing protein [bacterium]
MPKSFSFSSLKISLAFAFALSAFAAAAPARAAVIDRVAGKIENPTLAIDNRPETAATVKRAKNDSNFELFIYLKDAANIKSVSLSVKPDSNGAKIFASDDIVAWREIPAKTSKKAGKSSTAILVAPAKPFLTRYIRVIFPAGKTEKLMLFDVSVQDAPAALRQDNKIFDINVENITEEGAVIKYKTTNPSASQVRIGAGKPVFDQIFAIKELATDHKIILNKLTSGADYFFQVVLEESEPQNSKTSPVIVFHTSGTPPPEITKVDLRAPKSDSALLNLKANTPVKWRVSYGLYRQDTTVEKALNDPETAKESSEGLLADASFEITGLAPRTRYFLLVSATDMAGHEATSDMLGFETAPLNLALGKPVEGTFTNELEDPYIEKTDAPIKRVTDGDENYFTGFAKAWPTSSGIQWAQIDLGAELKAEEAVIVWSSLAVPQDYTLSTSSDGATWAQILKITDGKPGEGAAVTTGTGNSERGDPLTYVSAMISGNLRYLRLEIPKDAVVASQFGWKPPILAEINIYAQPR